MKVLRSLCAPLGVVIILCALSGCLQQSDVEGALSLASRHAGSVNRASEPLTPEQEHYLGRAVAAQILARYPALEDRAANNYLNQLGQALALCSSQPYTFGGYHFQLLNSGEVNAFAAPDGLIFVTRGMLSLVSGEGQLAAVLAHEIAHVQNKDALGAIQSSRMTEALAALGGDAARQYGPGGFSAQLLDLFSDSVNDIVQTLVTKGYSRNQEYAADALAKDILTRAGYDPQNLDMVLRAMEKRVAQGSAGFGSTHPTAGDRLQALAKAGGAGAAPAKEPDARVKRFKAGMGKYSIAAR